MFAFVGNATEDDSVSGLYAFAVDEQSGGLDLQQFVGQPHPHYVAVSPSGKQLFAASFVMFTDGSPGGSVYSYAIDPADGRLTEINHRVLPFTCPNFLQTDRSESFLLVACTSGGGIAVLPIDAEGALGHPSSVHAHPGTPWVPLGATVRPEQRPHDECCPHAIAVDPSNRLVIVPDLALDRIVPYRFDAGTGRLDPLATGVDLPRKTGPRHLVFHPLNGMMYVLNETASSLTVFSYDPDRGSVEPLHTVSALPPDFTGHNMSAELVLGQQGKFLYCTNRGHDSVAVFAVSGSAPYLEPLEWQQTHGRGPRGLALAPDERLMFVTNRGSDSVSTLAVDQASGRLDATGLSADVAAPSSIAVI